MNEWQQLLGPTLVAYWPNVIDRWIASGAKDAYVEQLSDLPFEEVAQAVSRLARTHVFPPSIAEIRLMVAEKQLALPSAERAEAMGDAAFPAPGQVDQAKYDALPQIVRQSIKEIGGSFSFKSMTDRDRRDWRDKYEKLRKKELATITEGPDDDEPPMPELTRGMD